MEREEGVGVMEVWGGSSVLEFTGGCLVVLLCPGEGVVEVRCVVVLGWGGGEGVLICVLGGGGLVGEEEWCFGVEVT